MSVTHVILLLTKMSFSAYRVMYSMTSTGRHLPAEQERRRNSVPIQFHREHLKLFHDSQYNFQQYNVISMTWRLICLRKFYVSWSSAKNVKKLFALQAKRKKKTIPKLVEFVTFLSLENVLLNSRICPDFPLPWAPGGRKCEGQLG